MSLVLGSGFDVVGDDEEEGYDGDYDDLVIGAAKKRRRRMRRGRRKIKVPTPRWMNATTSQGVSRPQEELDFLPFDTLTIAAGLTNGVLLARPQRPFRGERLVMGAISAGVDASALVAINPAIYVGAVQVGTTQGTTPIAAFAATAFGVRMSFPAAGQGTDYRIFVILPGGALKADVVVTATLFGRAMR